MNKDDSLNKFSPIEQGKHFWANGMINKQFFNLNKYGPELDSVSKKSKQIRFLLYAGFYSIRDVNIVVVSQENLRYNPT